MNKSLNQTRIQIYFLLPNNKYKAMKFLTFSAIAALLAFSAFSQSE
jgi:hypothetical protein